MPFVPGFRFRFGRRRRQAGGVAPTLPLLEHVRDLRPAEWLQASMTTFATSVASFLPGHFEAYARLRHPMEINDGTGSLPDAVIRRLTEHLEPATTTPADCWFAVWEGFGGSVVPGGLEPKLDLPHRRYHVFAGPIEAARTNFCVAPIHHQSANLWWPADHAWCVATEVDHQWTYVGGSRACIRSLLSDAQLEAVETTASSRI